MAGISEIFYYRLHTLKRLRLERGNFLLPRKVETEIPTSLWNCPVSDLQGRCNEKGKVSISCINEALLQNELLKKEVLFSKKIEVSKIGKKKKF